MIAFMIKTQARIYDTGNEMGKGTYRKLTSLYLVSHSLRKRGSRVEYKVLRDDLVCINVQDREIFTITVEHASTHKNIREWRATSVDAYIICQQLVTLKPVLLHDFELYHYNRRLLCCLTSIKMKQRIDC